MAIILGLTGSCLFFFCWPTPPAWPGGDNFQPCQDCHLPHPAGVTHELHPGVSCESCHLENGKPFRDPASGRIRFKRDRSAEISGDIHDDLKDVSDEQSCRECHFRGNPFGASAAVLPPKGILCLPCHTAGFSSGHPITIASLVIFGLGLLSFLMIWKRSSRAPEKTERGKKTRFFIRAVIFARALAAALFINQRLFRQSPGRWLIHGLMIYPLMMRCLWGLTALMGSRVFPQWTFIWPMLNRDQPATALFFDLTGLLMLSGFVLVLFRRIIRQKPSLSDRVTGLPRIDWLGFGLFGSLIISGFLVEALRLTMSGNAVPYAFVGYSLSRIMKGFPKPAVTYVYFWYGHFVITGGLVAYLPFSRLKHLFMGPVSMVIQSVREYEKKKIPGRQRNAAEK